MIKVNDTTVSTDGNMFELMIEFVAIVGWLRFEKHIPDGTIKKLVEFGLDRNSFDVLERE